MRGGGCSLPSESAFFVNLEACGWYQTNKARHGPRFGGSYRAPQGSLADSPWRAFFIQPTAPRLGRSPNTSSTRRIVTPLPPLPVRAGRNQPAGWPLHLDSTNPSTASLQLGPRWSLQQRERYRSDRYRRSWGLVDRSHRGRMPDAYSGKRFSRSKHPHRPHLGVWPRYI